jgi:UV DNA damage endonuclease
MWSIDDPVIIFQTPENPPDIHLGLCCINNTLRKNGKCEIFCSRTLTAKSYTRDKAHELALQNLRDLKTLLSWNHENGIRHFRVSSDLFPRITDNVEKLRVVDYRDILADIGEYARSLGQRLTMHPGQFNQIGAKDPDVFARTIEDLTVHADILDYMGMDYNAIITIHGGGVYGDKETTIQRWINQFSLLPVHVQRRIAIENCERQYNVADCLRIATACKIPVIFDSHHFDCYNSINNADFVAEDYIGHVLASWGDRRAVMHISEQKPDSRVGSHSDYIETIPSYMLSIPELYGVGVDIEVEAKAKELAIFKLRDKYHFI